MRKVILLLVFISLSGPGLAQDWFMEKGASDSFGSGEWQLVTLKGKAAPSEPLLVLKFQQNGVSGFAGVNRFQGSYKLEGESLTFGPLAATRMAGPPELMQLESSFLQMMAEVRAYRQDSQLTLYGQGKKELATFQHRD